MAAEERSDRLDPRAEGDGSAPAGGAGARSWPDGPVLGVRVESLEEKAALLAAEPDALFSIPHFDGYPGLLVRLDAIDRDRLAEIITDAWLLRAPARIAKEWLAEHGLE